MSTAAVTQQPDLDVVQHPVLGPLKFPKDMGPDERNESIDRAMAARPNAGLAPAAGGPNSESNPLHQDIDRNKYAATAGLPGGLPAPANDTMTALGALGVGAGATAVYGPSALRAAKPFILPAAGSYAISKARELPVVGPILKHIPFAEMIPWMASGRGKLEEEGAPPPPTVEEGPRFPSGNMRAQEGEYVGAQPATPVASGPPFAHSELVRSRALPESASAARDLPYRRGSGEVAPEDVSAPDENVLAGRQGVRIARPVERGPQRALPAASTEATPDSVARPKIAPVDTAKLGDLLNEGTGGELPEGHIAVKGSSLIRSYKYDPATKEFEAGLNGDSKNPGGVYVHGDVEPEAVAKFEAAKSKGTAWKELKDTPGVTYVGKIVNGKRVAAKPPRDLGSASPEDHLTPLLQKSLDAARKARTTRVAKPN